MHHSLRFYGKHIDGFLRFYIFLARSTKVPLLGKLVRGVANGYGKRVHQGYVLTLEQAREVVDASGSVALGPCSCRKVFGNCDNPIDVEIVVGLGTEAFAQIRPQEFRKISKNKAKSILELCHERHLAHTLAKCKGDFYAICNCCPCCCVPIRLRRDYNITGALGRDKKILRLFKRQGDQEPR